MFGPMTGRSPTPRCTLALADGTVLQGRSFGATGTRTGEVVFNTSMTGYQEIISDPSYCGQIVTLTYPHIGNYGANPDDVEAARPFLHGLVIKEPSRRYSNFRATTSLEEYLIVHGVVGLYGVDTRALVKRIRTCGAMPGVLTTEIEEPAAYVRAAAEAPSMVGADLVRVVAPRECARWASATGDAGFQIVAIDCGMKRTILRRLTEACGTVQIVPPTVTADEVMAYEPDGVFVSNGPGDPAAVHYAVELLKALLGSVPIFGICLGHQLLGRALGAETFKLRFGHHGANHPVRNLVTERIEITTQNHGFAVSQESVEAVGGIPTHVSLNDGTLEGFRHRELPLLAVQYHPEAGPGPHDASYLFDCFRVMMASRRGLSGEDLVAAQQPAGRQGSARDRNGATAG